MPSSIPHSFLGSMYLTASAKRPFVLVFFLWFTSPVSTHFLGQVEYYTNPLLGRHVKQTDLPEPADSPVQAGTEERKKGDGDGTD